MISLKTNRSALHKIQGFTLMELLVVMVIIGILAALALPAYKTMVLNQRIKTTIQDLYLSLSLARSEAAVRGLSDTVRVVPNSGTADWSLGWEVKADSAGKVKIFPAIKAVVVTGPNATLTYRIDGRLTALTQQVFTVAALNDSSVAVKCVIVSPSGQPVIRAATNGVCP